MSWTVDWHCLVEGGGGNGFGGCALVGVLDEEKGVKHVETDDERYDTVGGLVIRLSF